jgi:hypothetical protein
MTIHSRLTTLRKRIMAVCVSLLTLTTVLAAAGQAVGPPPAHKDTVGDGQHDFDWELGRWHTDVRLLAEPLSESEDVWLQFEGTSHVRPLSDRRANVVELDVSGPAGRIEGMNLRLYEPQAQRWSLTFVNLRDGLLTPSVYGGFDGKVGTFYGDDQLDGRPIKVRFVITRQGPDKARFEQAFSGDGGATWETNWIAVDLRIGA